jgi:hypothetical protein
MKRKPRKFRVLCPAESVTGGPEALHQLVHVAQKLGADSRIVYLPARDNVNDAYTHYKILTDIMPADSPDTVLVTPEIWPLDLNSLKSIIPVFWWLSYDYGARSLPVVNNKRTTHACQSYYAYDMLVRQGVDPSSILMLTDYTRSLFTAPYDEEERKDVCAYSPAKGADLTEKIIAANRDITFVPINGMSPDMVRLMLRKSKVYIDFGTHPGKDRIPREAVVSGCCVITASDRGAAQYLLDVPIPRHYKFTTKNSFDPCAIGDSIRLCMAEYPKCKADFNFHRACVQAEEMIFEDEVLRLLKRFECLA